ncbi:MAG: hypothetical protein AB1656_14815 [Candidatus Omnitrophota bacterium]
MPGISAKSIQLIRRTEEAPRILFLIALFLPIAVLFWNVLTGEAEAPTPWSELFDRYAFHRMGQSLAVGAFSVLFSLFLALPIYFSWLCLSTQCRRWTVAFSLLPLSFPPFGAASGWMTLAALWEQTSRGRIVWGVQGIASQWLYSPLGAGWILGLCFWPIIFLLMATISEPSQARIDASVLMMRPWTRFRKVILPAWKEPAVIAGALVFCLGTIQFEVPSLLQISVYPLEIFIRYSALMNERDALLLSLPYLLVLPFLGWLAVRAGEKFSTGLGEAHIGPVSPLIRWGAFGAAILILALSCLVPAAGLWTRCASLSVTLNAIIEQSEQALRSLAYGGAGGAVIVGLGIWFTASRYRGQSWTIPAGLLFLFTLPSVLIAGGWLQIRSLWPGRIPTGAALFSLLCAYVSHYFIIGYGAGILLWRRFGERQREMGALLKTGFLTRLRRLYLPSFLVPAIPAMAAAALFLWGDISITILLSPPGGETLAVEYYNLLHYGNDPRTAATGLLLLLAPATILLLAFAVWRLIYGMMNDE